MNKKEREQIDLNLYSRSLEYVRQRLRSQTFADIKGQQNEFLKECEKEHKEKCEMFEKYIEALRYDAKGDRQCIWRLRQEKELAEKKEKEYEQLYSELYNQKEIDIETKWEKIYNTRIEIYKKRNEEALDYQVKLRTREIEQELEKQKAINEKWKAMFTEQAMANAKLINKEEN